MSACRPPATSSRTSGGWLPGRARPCACTTAGGWFGEPEHQLEVLAALDDPSVGIVYNFHHGHAHVGRFAEILPRMLPHLRVVNVSGMDGGGEQILPVGSGTMERGLIKTLADAGFGGALGAIGHVEGADVQHVLQRNLDGLAQIASELEQDAH